MTESISKNRRRIFNIIVIFMIVFVLMEWLEYSVSSFMNWPDFPVGYKNSIKILIVGDPQLLGYRSSPSGIVGSICRWDADRYIYRTFSFAYDYVNPDLIVFLGDNLDEGEVATDEELYDYVKRFRRVFNAVDFDKAIIVPGDNDIGGEDGPPSPELEKRFDRYFRKDVFMKYEFLEFVKVNYITHSNDYLSAPNISENAIRIILSHIPLTTVYSTFSSRVIPYLKPHIILSAHDHKAAHWISKRPTGVLMHMASLSEMESFSFNISEFHIHEIIAPTCSYRMGTNKMGYGALEISSSGEATYVLLQLPSRFKQLFIYVFLIVCILLCTFCLSSKICLRLIFSRNTVTSHRLF